MKTQWKWAHLTQRRRRERTDATWWIETRSTWSRNHFGIKNSGIEIESITKIALMKNWMCQTQLSVSEAGFKILPWTIPTPILWLYDKWSAVWFMILSTTTLLFIVYCFKILHCVARSEKYSISSLWIFPRLILLLLLALALLAFQADVQWRDDSTSRTLPTFPVSSKNTLLCTSLLSSQF